ncbi:IS5/IS1182 family transposase, partial [Arcticibacter svalbardensis]|uniref:IS5/IS1182 family transposase n=1 Tax=Arcticibacter svalbardensis TaxID=1288027 RepID=UPI00058E0556
MRFLGLGLNDQIPDQNTIRNSREALIINNVLDSLFVAFNNRLEKAGMYTKKGSMVDASFVTAPRQRNSREENEQLKEGDLPEDWSLNKMRHKDTDADWTKKNNQVYFGYKNHVKVDIGSKLITGFETSSASVHDSEVLQDLLTEE